MQGVVAMKQVHGNRVIRVSSKDLGKVIQKCDGLITNDSEIGISVHAADCLPVFFHSPATNSIGVVHAGWRGLDNKIIEVAVEKMIKEFGGKNSDLNVYVGPHICRKHYEIGKDVLEKFKDYEKAIRQIDGKFYLDLGEVARLQLIRLGVKKIKIDKTCTFESKDLDSWRRKDMKRRTNYIFKVSSNY